MKADAQREKPTQATRVCACHDVGWDFCCHWCADTDTFSKIQSKLDDVVIGLFEGQFQKWWRQGWWPTNWNSTILVQVTHFSRGLFFVERESSSINKMIWFYWYSWWHIMNFVRHKITDFFLFGWSTSASPRWWWWWWWHIRTQANVHAQTTITIPLGEWRKYCSFYEFHKICAGGRAEEVKRHDTISFLYWQLISVVHVTFCIHMRMQ